MGTRKKIIIKRSQWSRGRLASNALLIGKKIINEGKSNNADAKAHGAIVAPLPKIGTMCCLGFVALSEGASISQIRNISLPCAMKCEIPLLNYNKSRGLRDLQEFRDTDFSSEASSINDDGGIDEKERESRLQNIAEIYGRQFVFVD